MEIIKPLTTEKRGYNATRYFLTNLARKSTALLSKQDPNTSKIKELGKVFQIILRTRNRYLKTENFRWERECEMKIWKDLHKENRKEVAALQRIRYEYFKHIYQKIEANKNILISELAQQAKKPASEGARSIYVDHDEIEYRR